MRGHVASLEAASPHRTMTYRVPTFIAAVFAAFATHSHAEVKLPAVISDHMVLQRDMPAPVWGTAAAEEEVLVSIAGQTKKTVAGMDGKWAVRLDPMQVAEGLTLTVQGTNRIEVTDVMVGEVWLRAVQHGRSGAQLQRC